MTTQTPPPAAPQESRLSPEDLEYARILCDEIIDLTDPAERDSRLRDVAELIGDVTLSEELRQQAWEHRQAAEALAHEFRTKRAEEAAKKMETKGFAEVAPGFEEQLLEDDRGTPFIYNNQQPFVDPGDWPQHEGTEIDGLQELNTFLHEFVDLKNKQGEHPYPEVAEQAQSILDNLTFIGDKELKEATYGLGQLWKAYLDGDPGRKICLLTNISDSSKYPGQQKSDVYLRDRIFETFSAEDVEKYKGRIVENLADIKGEPASKVRIILLDDWTISGTQLNRVYRDIIENPDYHEFLRSIEINLIVASKKRLEKGLEDPMSHPSFRPVKVRAYFMSHAAEGARSRNESHVSGLHSTVNFDFGDPIEAMVKLFEKEKIIHPIPALASIVSPYKQKIDLRDKS
jgi:hypothetical protein